MRRARPCCLLAPPPPVASWPTWTRPCLLATTRQSQHPTCEGESVGSQSHASTGAQAAAAPDAPRSACRRPPPPPATGMPSAWRSCATDWHTRRLECWTWGPVRGRSEPWRATSLPGLCRSEWRPTAPTPRAGDGQPGAALPPALSSAGTGYLVGEWGPAHDRGQACGPGSLGADCRTTPPALAHCSRRGAHAACGAGSRGAGGRQRCRGPSQGHGGGD